MRGEVKGKFKPNYPTLWLDWMDMGKEKKEQIFVGVRVGGEKSSCKEMMETNIDLLIVQNNLKLESKCV